jgi:hypothetical protein
MQMTEIRRLVDSFSTTLKMEVASSSETSVLLSTWHSLPEDNNAMKHHVTQNRENYITRNFIIFTLGSTI